MTEALAFGIHSEIANSRVSRSVEYRRIVERFRYVEMVPVDPDYFEQIVSNLPLIPVDPGCRNEDNNW